MPHQSIGSSLLAVCNSCLYSLFLSEDWQYSDGQNQPSSSSFASFAFVACWHCLQLQICRLWQFFDLLDGYRRSFILYSLCRICSQSQDANTDISLRYCKQGSICTFLSDGRRDSFQLCSVENTCILSVSLLKGLLEQMSQHQVQWDRRYQQWWLPSHC